MKQKSPIYVIEHLEKKLWPWCIIEYKNISEIVGKKNLWFTNINKKDKIKLKNYGKVLEESVKRINLKNACILDPEAKRTLAPKEARKFSYFIFGGILGDSPPRKRTNKELTKFFRQSKARNIGKEQFSTDNAIAVVKKIVNGKFLNELNFKEGIEIKINSIESTLLPYRYLIKNKKPLISKELIKYLKVK